MADDTLSPIGFDTSRVVKTHLEPEHRFAMACAWGDIPTSMAQPQAAFVRYVMLLGLERLGWGEAKIIKEYAAYRLRCIRNEEPNVFESE